MQKFLVVFVLGNGEVFTSLQDTIELVMEDFLKNGGITGNDVKVINSHWYEVSDCGVTMMV